MIDITQWRAKIGHWNCSCTRTANRSTAVKQIDMSQVKLTLSFVIIVSLLLILAVKIHYLHIDSSTTNNLICNSTCTSDSMTGKRYLWSIVMTMTDSSILSIHTVFFILIMILLSGDVELNPGPGTIARDILQNNSDQLTAAISLNLMEVTNGLYAKKLIPLETKDYMLTIGIPDYTKASKLMTVIQQQLESSYYQDQYLIRICNALINLQVDLLTEIASFMIMQLGHTIPSPLSFTCLQQLVGCNVDYNMIYVKKTSQAPTNVQQYADIIRNRYKLQPIVAIDWPPRVGKDFFGRLALIIKDSYLQKQTDTAWLMLRGKIDEILLNHWQLQEINIEDILKPCDPPSPLRVLVDGPPGIGKTTLCRKLCNMWANGSFRQYVLVLYCPLRNSKIAQATTLADMCHGVYKCLEVEAVCKWIEQSHGEGLLIIFDGWDELSTELRYSSLAASIIHREQLSNCSVIITSRSYASSSILDELDSLSRHVQVIGFTEQVIAKVIKGTLKGTEAEALINELKVRGDVRSLCYIPLVCSMVILVYRKLGGLLPKTLTELYENFILQTIKRHVRRTHCLPSVNPRQLSSLDYLPSKLATPLREMCQFAYLSLKKDNNKMTFHVQELHQFLNESIEEDYLGLMTSFSDYDDEIYQFLHLSIQEFLAAWWIVKDIDLKTEEVFKEHFNDDHFCMCLRFVAGLTHLKPDENYQQYFNKSLDLQCKKSPIIGYDFHLLSSLYQTSVTWEHHTRKHNYDKRPQIPILLFQLLYESQNTKLCHVLAKSNNHSLCFDNIELTLFDTLCLSYVINNTTWNNLHLGWFRDSQSLSVFTSGLTSLQNKCKRLEIALGEQKNSVTLRKLAIEPSVNASVHLLLQTFLLQNVRECYCDFSSYYKPYDHSFVLLSFIKLPQLKILHLNNSRHNIVICKLFEIEECLAMSTLQEIKLDYTVSLKDCIYGIRGMIETDEEKEEIEMMKRAIHWLFMTFITHIFKGIAINRHITSLTLFISYNEAPLFVLPDGTVEQFLRNNHTLQALALSIPDNFLLKSLSIKEVNAPLTTLWIKQSYNEYKLNKYLVPNIKGLQCLSTLILPCTPSLVFFLNPNLQSLTIELSYMHFLRSTEISVEFLTILQTNSSLKTLAFYVHDASDKICTCLHDMLIRNHTLQCLDIDCQVDITFLYYLTTGLIQNTTLQELRVPIPVGKSTIKQIGTFFIKVISEKTNLTKLFLNFTEDECDRHVERNESEAIMASLFYEQILILITKMLLVHDTITQLKITDPSNQYSNQYKPNYEKVVQLYEVIALHPTIEYIGLWRVTPLMEDILTENKEKLIVLHKQHSIKTFPVIENCIMS